jgi:hypothetical protein
MSHIGGLDMLHRQIPTLLVYDAIRSPFPPLLLLFFVVPVFILLTLFFNYKFINYIQFKHRRHSLLCHSLCIHELVLQLGNTYVSILFPISHKRITYSRYQACTL